MAAPVKTSSGAKKPVGQPAVQPSGSAAAPAGTVTSGKVRAGMGDVISDFVEVYSDVDYDRATALLSILSPQGKADPARVPNDLEPSDWIAMYRSMLLIRMLDERLMLMQRQGRVGFYSDARGQEAAVIAPLATLGPADWVVPSHREGGAALHRGLPLTSYIAQIFGNGGDISQGRQMPVHTAAPRALRFLPISSCVATQLPQATGIAWAAKIKKDQCIVLAYLGEGATSAEDFHTGMNFAAVFKVPVVFVCVNNGWAVSTPAAVQSASETFAVKALAYGMPGIRVDGNDVFAIHQATREATERARRGEGPTLIEAVTYRLGGHSSSDDPTLYRDAADVERREAEEPLRRFALWLNEAGILDNAQQETMRDAIDAEIKEAVAATEGLAAPALRTLIEDVYATPPRALEEQLADLERIRSAPDLTAKAHVPR